MQKIESVLDYEVGKTYKEIKWGKEKKEYTINFERNKNRVRTGKDSVWKGWRNSTDNGG